MARRRGQALQPRASATFCRAAHRLAPRSIAARRRRAARHVQDALRSHAGIRNYQEGVASALLPHHGASALNHHGQHFAVGAPAPMTPRIDFGRRVAVGYVPLSML